MPDLFGGDDKETQQDRAIAELAEQIQLLQQLRIDPSSVKSAINAEKIRMPSDILAGEALLNGDAVRIGIQDQADDLRDIVSQTSQNTQGAAFQTSSAWQTFIMPTILPERLKKIVLYVDKTVGGGTTNIKCQIGDSSGTVLANSDALPVGNAPVAAQEMTFTFSGVNIITLESNTTYKVRCTVVDSGTYHIYYQNSDVYAGGAYEGATGDIYMKLQATDVNGRCYKNKATTAALANAQMGICNAPLSAGQAMDGILFGIKGDYASSLTANNEYYLSDTRGVIATSAGTVSRKVGIALSTKTLFIEKR